MVCYSAHSATSSASTTSTLTTVDSLSPHRTQHLAWRQFASSKSSPLRSSVLASEIDIKEKELCKDRHFVLRRFLEPICDPCVLKEHRELMVLHAEDPLNGEGLVWSSEVQIEIDPVPRDSISLSRFPRPQNSSSDITLSPLRGRCNVATPFSDGDADDEGSLSAPSPLLTDIRGRPRSRTKQFRRRGIDLSRDELRISSRWDNVEKQSMEDFRSAIKEKASGNSPDGLFKLWTGRSTGSRVKETNNLKSIVKDIRSSVSRGRRRQIITGEAVALPVPGSNAGQLPGSHNSPVAATACLSPFRSPQSRPLLRRVHSSASLRRTTLENTDISQMPDFEPRQTEDESSISGLPDTSWQRHLEQDLKPTIAVPRHGKKGRYLLQDGTETNDASLSFAGRAVLPSDYFPDHNAANHQASRTLPYLRPSVTTSELSDLHLESYWRLPSLAKSMSYSNDLSSPDFSMECARNQQSCNVMNAREFDSAWWKNTSANRNVSSTSSQPVTTIASRSTSTFSGSTEADMKYAEAAKASIAEMVAALKLKLAADINEYEATSARPLLQPSVCQGYECMDR